MRDVNTRTCHVRMGPRAKSIELTTFKFGCACAATPSSWRVRPSYSFIHSCCIECPSDKIKIRYIFNNKGNLRRHRHEPWHPWTRCARSCARPGMISDFTFTSVTNSHHPGSLLPQLDAPLLNRSLLIAANSEFFIGCSSRHSHNTSCHHLPEQSSHRERHEPLAGKRLVLG